MPSFENIKNDALCAGVILAAPFRADDVAFYAGKNINGKYVKAIIARIELFGASPEITESIVSVHSLYEKRFVKNKTGENR